MTSQAQTRPCATGFPSFLQVCECLLDIAIACAVAAVYCYLCCKTSILVHVGNDGEDWHSFALVKMGPTALLTSIYVVQMPSLDNLRGLQNCLTYT